MEQCTWRECGGLWVSTTTTPEPQGSSSRLDLSNWNFSWVHQHLTRPYTSIIGAAVGMSKSGTRASWKYLNSFKGNNRMSHLNWANILKPSFTLQVWCRIARMKLQCRGKPSLYAHCRNSMGKRTPSPKFIYTKLIPKHQSSVHYRNAQLKLPAAV